MASELSIKRSIIYEVPPITFSNGTPSESIGSLPVEVDSVGIVTIIVGAIHFDFALFKVF